MNRKKILTIAQIAILAGILIFVILIMRQGISREVPMDQIAQAMEKQPGVDELLRKDDLLTYSSFGMVPDSYVYYKSDDIMDVRELLIARAADGDQMDQLQAAASKRVAEQSDNFENYGTNQFDLLQHALTMQRGDYFFYAVGDEAEQWQAAFLKVLAGRSE